ncbi:MAG: DNA-formamidopyrimidine glycosylase [bacterium]
MPELPEIETLKNEIISYGLIGKRIIEININDLRTINMPANKFKKSILGESIEGVERRGKNLILNLSNKGFIAIHLKLFGQMRVSDKPILSQLSFCFDNGKSLCLSQLAFGAGASLFLDTSLEDVFNLGKDALKISISEFKEILKKGKVKPILMEQKKIAGIGNTYADEILFLSKINPERDASSLKEDEIRVLYKAMGDILNEAIKNGGVTLDDFIHLDGRRGNFRCRVHNREGEACLSCNSAIKKIRLGGRGTFFCPNCQI